MAFSEDRHFYCYYVLQRLHYLLHLSVCSVCHCERVLRCQLVRVLFCQQHLLYR
ncbi:hypothetical protein GQ44DRAFT_701325, partial [Phaeosphaeriaceae sp. PMI808]